MVYDSVVNPRINHPSNQQILEKIIPTIGVYGVCGRRWQAQYFHFHVLRMPTRSTRRISLGIAHSLDNEYCDTNQLKRSQGLTDGKLQLKITSSESFRDLNGSCLWHVYTLPGMVYGIGFTSVVPMPWTSLDLSNSSLRFVVPQLWLLENPIYLQPRSSSLSSLLVS